MDTNLPLSEKEIDEMLDTPFGKKLLNSFNNENQAKIYLRDYGLPSVQEITKLWRESEKKEIRKLKRELKSKEDKEKKKTVKKPRTLHNSELDTPTYLMEVFKEKSELLNGYSEKDVEDYIELHNLCMLSNSYGFLTDAILRYIRDYVDGKTKCVAVGISTTDNPDIKKEDVLIIEDSFNNFCKMAGTIDHNQKQILIEEIEKNKFSMIGLVNLNVNKIDRTQFTKENFLTYKFTYKPCVQLKNLKNVDKTEAIDTIRIEFNKRIFTSILKKGKTKTKGYYLIPQNLEKWLRQTVSNHKDQLIQFSQHTNLKYIKGGDYTKTIRPMFNLLVRELGQPVQKDGELLYQITKPIETYAKQCCERAFFIDKSNGKKKFNKKLAIESMAYALETLKYLYQDGIEQLNIKNYSFTSDNIIIEIKKVATLEAKNYLVQ